MIVSLPSSVDNSLCAALCAFRKRTYNTWTTFATHPLSGTPIVGFRVPYYDRVIAFVDELSREIPEVPYVGWDVAIAPDGPVVIEGNPNSGVYQSKPSVSGIRTGLLPRYRAAIGF